MEISDVRRRLTATIEQARRGAAERRTRHDEAAREYGVFLYLSLEHKFLR